MATAVSFEEGHPTTVSLQPREAANNSLTDASASLAPNISNILSPLVHAYLDTFARLNDKQEDRTSTNPANDDHVPKSAIIRNRLQVIKELESSEAFRALKTQFDHVKTTAQTEFKTAIINLRKLETEALSKRLNLEFAILLEMISNTVKSTQFANQPPTKTLASEVFWLFNDRIRPLITIGNDEFVKNYNEHFPNGKLSVRSQITADTSSPFTDSHRLVAKPNSDFGRRIEAEKPSVTATIFLVVESLLIKPSETYTNTYRDQVVASRLRNIAQQTNTTAATETAHAIVQSERPETNTTLDHMLDRKIQALQKEHMKKMASMTNQLKQAKANINRLTQKNMRTEGTEHPPEQPQRSKKKPRRPNAPPADGPVNATPSEAVSPPSIPHHLNNGLRTSNERRRSGGRGRGRQRPR
jgi:hypothetical protein